MWRERLLGAGKSWRSIINGIFIRQGYLSGRRYGKIIDSASIRVSELSENFILDSELVFYSQPIYIQKYTVAWNIDNIMMNKLIRKQQYFYLSTLAEKNNFFFIQALWKIINESD